MYTCTRVHTDLEGKLVVEVEEKTREHHVGDDVIGAEALVRVEPCEPDTHIHIHIQTHPHTNSVLRSVIKKRRCGVGKAE